MLYLLCLTGSAVFYISYREWFSWIALLAVLGIPWVSLAISLPGMLTLAVSPRVPDHVKAGVPAEATLVGTTKFPIPIFRGKLRVTRRTTAETWNRKDGHLPTEHCGGLVIAPRRVWVYDYLGLFRMPKRRPAEKILIVRPAPVRMETPPDLSRYLARSWRPKPGGGFSENHELRLYRPGDSLSLVHWKLTAKTGKLILREPMEPVRGLVLLTMDLSGSAEVLDTKFGQLLWLGGFLLEKNIAFSLRVLTGEGLVSRAVACEQDLQKAVDTLLCCPPVSSGSVRERPFAASWQYHIGGEPDEA